MPLEKLREELIEGLRKASQEAYEAREASLGSEQMRRIEQWVMLQVIDTKWKDHLYAMDHLREGIGYRVYGQQDPLVEYQHEAYEMFTQMIQSIRAETVKLIYRIQAVHPEEQRRVLAPTQFLHPEAPSATAAVVLQADSSPKQPEGFALPEQEISSATTTYRRDHPKVGRNDPCPCGSGKKFKKCHGAAE